MHDKQGLVKMFLARSHSFPLKFAYSFYSMHTLKQIYSENTMTDSTSDRSNVEDESAKKVTREVEICHQELALLKER